MKRIICGAANGVDSHPQAKAAKGLLRSAALRVGLRQYGYRCTEGFATLRQQLEQLRSLKNTVSPTEEWEMVPNWKLRHTACRTNLRSRQISCSRLDRGQLLLELRKSCQIPPFSESPPCQAASSWQVRDRKLKRVLSLKGHGCAAKLQAQWPAGLTEHDERHRSAPAATSL